MKRVVSTILLVILLTSMLYLAFKIMPAEAAGTIYIRADGSIDPPTAPISRDGDTYTFTGNVSNGAIVVERDNVVVDGASYTLQGTGSGTGIVISGRSNVTIRSVTIKAFHYAIWLESSSNSSISGNTITNNEDGIMLYPSSNYNRISGNTITNNRYYGIWLYSFSNYNRISGNTITNNWYGLGLDTFSSYNSVSGNNMTGSNGYGIVLYEYSSYNSVSGNNIANNLYGISLGNSSSYNGISENNITENNESGILLSSSSDSSIFHNNFMDNTRQVYDVSWDYPEIPSSINIWDDGYPSGGNYWSDYTGVDGDGDGIGDTPHILDAQNVDNYPLMQPFTKIQIPGDINNDGTVDIFDCVVVALAFGSKPGDPNWNPVADINNDGIVDIFDIVVVALHFGEAG